MDAFAIYRLPHASQCTLVGQHGVPDGLKSLSSLKQDSSGFVIAPFSPDDCSPILLLRPDVVRQYTLDEVPAIDDLPYYLDGGNNLAQPSSRESYNSDFARFHRTFSAFGYQKLVLARNADVPHSGTHPVTLFKHACEHYPEACVTLFSAPQCGTWLMATPEVLLERGTDDIWHTMALAGTMRYAEQLPPWSDKNVHEQDFVAQYIKACLEQFTDEITVTGPYTTRAGSLVHLRTDFNFTLPSDAGVGEVLYALHPTPAVCGLPKADALRFIINNETCNRSYYSGFSGPLNVDGTTAMYVSLRCMRILADRYRLYAGGGILPQSVDSQEWDETSAKMQSMLTLIQ